MHCCTALSIACESFALRGGQQAAVLATPPPRGPVRRLGNIPKTCYRATLEVLQPVTELKRLPKLLTLQPPMIDLIVL
jgi:hypothetical protein